MNIINKKIDENSVNLIFADPPYNLQLGGDLLRPDLWVSEIVYFPIQTELLVRARDAGCRTVDGAGMAAEQAVRAFELFTGVTPDAPRMHARVRAMVA